MRHLSQEELLAGLDGADAYFAQAAAMSERLGARFFGARSDLWWGQMLVARDAPGDAGRARELLSIFGAMAHLALFEVRNDAPAFVEDALFRSLSIRKE